MHVLQGCSWCAAYRAASLAPPAALVPHMRKELARKMAQDAGEATR